ncbi:MAG: hypothetical protein KDD44_05750, partial [Bdellovibrionales bacterium]|nr:hypothetical protein [Bdellovibrionales bacterium]
QPGPGPLLLLLLAISFGIHFRPGLFFYWDEWQVLERLYIIGREHILSPHNEHFIPLFFSFYWLETLIFREHYAGYIAVSLFLHAVNGLLVYHLFSLIQPSAPSSRRSAIGASILFVACSLAGEVTQWAFLQSVLLGSAGMLGCLVLSLRYLQTGAHRHLAGAALLAFVAPLCFGGALILPLLAIALLVGLGFQYRDIAVSSFLAPNVQKRRTVQLIVGIGTACGMTTAAYILMQPATSDVSTGSVVARLIAHPLSLAAFLALGTQVGGLLGTIGLFPVQLAQPPKPLFSSFVDGGLHSSLGALVIASTVGFGATWAIRRYSVRGKRKPAEAVRLIALGQIGLLLVFFLPALGRYHFGLEQAFSLRHQYALIPWALLCVLPLLRTKAPWSRVVPDATFVLGMALLALYFSAHLSYGFRDTYFRKHGTDNRAYIAKLRDWNAIIGGYELSDADTIRASGTAVEFQEPTRPPRLTPDMAPDQIYRLMYVFDPRHFQFRSGFEPYLPDDMKKRVAREALL